MSDPLINRVYDLKVAGYDDAIQKVNALTAAFTKMDGTKKKLNESLQKKLEAGDTAAIKQLTDQIKALEIEMGNLSKKREASAKEVELLARAEKSEADAKLASVKADREKIKSIIDQDKELDRQIALEEKKSKVSAQTVRDLKSEADNYYALLRAQRAALELYRITPTTSPFFEQVKQGAIDAKAKVDAFNRSLSPDGTLVGEYKTGILNAFKNLGLSDVLKQQGNDIKNQLEELVIKNKTLAEQYRKTSVQGGDAFNKIDAELKESIHLQQQMEANLHEINTAFQGTGSIGSQITKSLSNEFKGLKENIGQVVVGYVGFQAVLSGVSSLVSNTKTVSDSLTEIEVNEGKAKGGADSLVKALRQIDTRTTLQGLLDISDVALKAGTTNENLEGVTEAIDKVKVAFGKDFGSIEQGTETFAKLIAIFFKDGEITGDRILNIGNAIRTLANETTASVPFLTDFAGRMAGVKQIANVSLADIIGLGAGFEQFKQSAEVSSTALVKIIPKLATDSAKYADILGITAEKYKELINADPTKVLIDVAEKLVKSGKGIEEVSSALADSELGSGRITTILATLGGKADVFRERIARAGSTINDSGSITDAFNAKNTNLAGTLDKLSKKFTDLGGNKGFQITLLAIGSTISFLLGNIPIIIGLLSLFGLRWLTLSSEITLANGAMALTNGQLLIKRLQLAQLIVQQALYKIQVQVATYYQLAYNAAISLYTGLTNRATAVTTLFGNATKLLPLGILLTILGVLAATFRALGSEITGSTDALRKQALQQRINADIQKEAAKATSDQRAEASLLVSIVKDLSISEETRNASLKKLLDLDPAFQKALVDGKLNYIELDKALTSYNEKLLKSAELEASRARQSKEFGKLTDLNAIKQELEIAQKAGKGFGDLSEDAQKAFSKTRTSVGRIAFTSDLLNLSINNKDFKEALGDITKEITTQLQNVDAAQQVFADKQKAIDAGKIAPGVGGTIAAGPLTSVFERFKKLVSSGGTEGEFKTLKDDIGKQKAGLNILSKEYKDLVALEKQLDDFLNPKNKAARASRLTGPQKDAFKDIDAARDEQLAAEKLKFTQLQEDEEQYLRNVLRINITAADAKLKILKGTNAEERKQISELRLFKIDQEAETNKKILELRSKTVIRNTDDSKRQAETTLNNVTDDPSKTNLEKLRARAQYLSTILAIQATSNAQLDQLEKQFGLKSAENEKKRRDALLDITKDLAKTQSEIIRESYEEQLKLIDESTRRLSNETKINISTRTIAVLQDDSQGPHSKALQLKQLEIEETKNLLALDVANAKNALAEKEKALKQGLATQTEVSDARTKLALAELAAVKNAANQEKSLLDKFQEGFKDAIANLTNFFKGIKASQADIDATIGSAVQTVSKTITEAKQAYFDNQRAQVDKDKEIALQRLDIQQQQLLDAAQSEEEKASIQAQFDDKRKKEEKKAGEEKKKIALTQLTIDFGIAVVKTLAAYPFPFSLIPVAALAAYYAVQRGQVNRQQFDKGGFTGPGSEKDHTGHRVAGVVHDNEWVSPKWMVGHPTYGKVIHQLESVRRRGFADGGFTGLGDFKLGDRLQAPINVGAFLNNANSDQLNKLSKMVETVTDSVNNVSDAVVSVSQRIDNIKVQVVAKEVDDRNIKTKKASARGTI